MADRVEMARKYMAAQRDGKIDEAVAMLADDVVMVNPMTGTSTGKAAAEQGLRNRPAGGGGAGNITWREPVDAEGSVKIVGDGSPFGPIRILISFNDKDLISKVDVGLGS